MFDLETMSTRPNAAILSIGAVIMDLDKYRIRAGFYQNIELSSCADVGLHVSVATRDWWAAQQPEARDALTKDAVGIAYALYKLRDWLLDSYDSAITRDDIVPWGNGAAFDVVILESAFEACGLTVPWHFYNHMCYRTKKNEHRDTVPLRRRVGIKHNALDDATTQALHLFEIYRYERRPRTLLERFSSWANQTYNAQLS